MLCANEQTQQLPQACSTLPQRPSFKLTSIAIVQTIWTSSIRYQYCKYSILPSKTSTARHFFQLFHHFQHNQHISINYHRKPLNSQKSHSPTMLTLPTLLLTTALFLTHLTPTTAQSGSLLSGSLPACAPACPLLQQAATGCVPPSAPATDQKTYKSCFCQSALLTSLQQKPSVNICAPQCSDADFAAIDVWYRNVCPGGGGAAGGGQTTLVTSTSTAAGGAETPNPTTMGNDAPSSSATPGGDRSDEAGVGNGQAW